MLMMPSLKGYRSYSLKVIFKPYLKWVKSMELVYKALGRETEFGLMALRML